MCPAPRGSAGQRLDPFAMPHPNRAIRARRSKRHLELIASRAHERAPPTRQRQRLDRDRKLRSAVAETAAVVPGGSTAVASHVLDRRNARPPQRPDDTPQRLIDRRSRSSCRVHVSGDGSRLTENRLEAPASGSARTLDFRARRTFKHGGGAIMRSTNAKPRDEFAGLHGLATFRGPISSRHRDACRLLVTGLEVRVSDISSIGLPSIHEYSHVVRSRSHPLYGL